ncbi:MAG: hydantoinase B/oxoprolinase family protein, partial [Pseudomonadota bacterium]
GGMGATYNNDGQSTYAWPSNVSNVPLELIERESGLRICSKELRAGSGGAGRHRGGLGQEIVLEVVSKTPVGMIFMAERCKFPARGIDGGGDGARGQVLIDGEAIDHRKNVVLKHGQVVTLRTPGGAGVGNAEEREPAALETDKVQGYVSG